MNNTCLQPGELRITQKDGVFTPDCADPRPDLTRDSTLWTRLLESSWDPDNSELFFTLHGFRCNSLRLVQGMNSYVLRPEFDAQSGFNNEAHYRELRDKHLMPHKDRLEGLLRGLGA